MASRLPTPPKAPAGPPVAPEDLHAVRERLDQLRDEVHAVLTEHFADTVTQLRQVQSLVRDAALKLIPQFRGMSERARESAKLARGIAAGEDGAEESLERVVDALAASSREVTQSLQFEDVANQLLDHVDRRLKRVMEFADDMSLLRADAPGRTVAVSAGEIADLEERLVVHRQRLEELRRRTVHQETVDPGTVDLF
jgi:hypothetical protein